MVLVLLLISFASCHPDKFCKNYSINTVFIGFAQTDIDTFVLRKYQQGDNFKNLVDSVLVINPQTNGGYANGRYTISNDTTLVFVNDNSGGISPPYDWIVYIPAINRLDSISNIVTKSDGNKSCGDEILSFMQNGILIDAPYYTEDIGQSF